MPVVIPEKNLNGLLDSLKLNFWVNPSIAKMVKKIGNKKPT